MICKDQQVEKHRSLRPWDQSPLPAAPRCSQALVAEGLRVSERLRGVRMRPWAMHCPSGKVHTRGEVCTRGRCLLGVAKTWCEGVGALPTFPHNTAPAASKAPGGAGAACLTKSEATVWGKEMEA